MEDSLHPSISSLASQVLTLAQSRLAADLRFLSNSITHLQPVSVSSHPQSFATDGQFLYYGPADLLRSFRSTSALPPRMLLHTTLHCLLGHPFQKQKKDRLLWNLSCDLSVEQIICELKLDAYTLPLDASREKQLSVLCRHCPHKTAQEFYNYLLEGNFSDSKISELAQLFEQDSHHLWFSSAHSSRRSGASQNSSEMFSAESSAIPEEFFPVDQHIGAPTFDDPIKNPLRNEWKHLAQQVQTDLSTFSQRFGRQSGSLMDNLAPITFEECDYTEFLRRFGTQNEVMELSDDAFDLLYYTYGLKTYGNIPLIEPLEYRDDKRIREFAIAIDTSGSVQGEIVQDFLQRTCNVLRQSSSFTTEVIIYLIQCDADVQSVEKLTDLDQLETVVSHLQLKGFGGTDFRPVFDYVDQLLEQRILTELNGLLYFTDGVGTYPEKAPTYKTAFIFHRDDCISPNVPSWAIRAVLTTDNIRLLNTRSTRSEEETALWI